jgi:hypothetical protein
MARLSRWTANVSPVTSTPGEELLRETIAAVTLVLVALATRPASADKLDSSADYFLPRCRAVVNHDFNQLFDVGVCLGAMAALHDTPSLLDRHPQRLQENFVKLAMPALHEAWPCAE